MTTRVLSPLALAGIRLYQRHLSPLKGFRCANGAESGVKSCSAFGRFVYARYDVATATALLQRRFAACRAAFQRYKAKTVQRTTRTPAKPPGRSRCDDGGVIAECACQGASGACDIGACV